LQSQLDRFTKLNTDYRTRNSLSNRQIQQLLEEKAELEVQLREKAPSNTVQMRRHKTESDGIDTSEKAVNRESCNLEEWQKMLESDGKVIIDLSNPERPRYSLNDMRKVIQERNDLKTRLFDAKEELLLYRPPSQSDDTEAAVQGPINREPDEKLHPEKFSKPSGIQRLFQSFLKVSTKQ
jgi:RILP-like protein 1